MSKSPLILVAVFFIFGTAFAQDSVPNLPVSAFKLRYGAEVDGLPSIANLNAVEVTLTRHGNVLTGPDASAGEVISVSLGQELPADTSFTSEGLHAVFSAIVRDLNSKGLFGVYVIPAREDVDAQSGQDLRTGDNRVLNLVVWVSVIETVRTVAKGDRISGDPIDHPKHRSIAQNSPLKARAEGAKSNLFEKLKLDDYLRRLNRQPGRRVDAALSAAENPGGVVLDYLVNESRPWFIYGQISNTGTKATNELRERIGVVHNQLFNRDDIASLDFITSNLDEANAVFGSYSFPVIFPDRLRVRGYGSWGDFAAITPAVSGGPPDEFSGNSWLGGVELTASPWSFRNVAVDFTVGIAMQSVEVDNRTLLLRGEAELVTPYVAVRFERESEILSFNGSIGYETNIEDTPTTELVRLGRLDTNSSYDLLKAEFSGSMFLEPLLKRPGTLAHELAINIRGQYAFGDNRLIPQKEMAIGGMFSVRGYPESVVAGDRAFFASAEYRFHYPRSLRPASVKEDPVAGPAPREDRNQLFGRPFTYRPPRPYARPDWDLIFRAFVDAGATQINDGTAPPRPEDRDQSLLGAGIGFELQLFRNFNLRADAGWALSEVKTGTELGAGAYIPGFNDVSAGSMRGHFLLTVVW